MGRRLPLIAVDHLEAHFHAVCLEGVRIEYPFLGLLLSGGNSSIYIVHGATELECIADTSDDALGEAFDKAASILNLPYPGGPSIESESSRATHYETQESLFPRLLRNIPGTELGFSFSGIKTAVIRAHRAGESPTRISRDFQNSTDW